MIDLAPLGDAVRQARLASGMTLRSLAERSGVSQRFLSDLERGKGNISIGRLVAISQALGVTLGRLVEPLDRAFLGPRPTVLALVGLRGAGKSSIGAQAAESLELPFVELDKRIEQAAGLPLAQIFEIHGESYYRRLEYDVLLSILQDAAPQLLAAGGGLVTAPESWRLLRQRSKTVWLKAEPEAHYQRVMAQGDLRPMENRPSAMAELKALLKARSPLYAQADETLDTSALGAEQTKEALIALYRSLEQPS